VAGYAVTERKVLDSTDIAKVLGAFTTAITVGSGFLYSSYRRLKRDVASDKKENDERATSEAANALQRGAMEMVNASLKQSQAFAERMEKVARDAQSAAHRDRRLRQIAEARLARVQKQAADDREADRREVERLQRRVNDLEALVQNRRSTDDKR
jgi:hypothetical protein